MIILLIFQTFWAFHRYNIFLNVASNYQWVYNQEAKPGAFGKGNP